MQNTKATDYSFIVPSLDALLSDDALYFEGVLRPAEYYVFRDAPSTADDPLTLERYWNDIYNLFLRKLSTFSAEPVVDHEESVKLQALLQELIKVKELLAGAKGRDLSTK